MGFIENLIAKILSGIPEEQREGAEVVLPPLPWSVEAGTDGLVPTLSRTSVREQEGVTIKDTLSQVTIGKVPEGIEPVAMAQARGVQHSREGVVVFEESTAFSRIEDYGSSAHGVAGTPAIKARRRGLRR